jgi:hypothetical protein
MPRTSTSYLRLKLRRLDVILQGVILGFPHDVTITLNGATLGDRYFSWVKIKANFM